MAVGAEFRRLDIAVEPEYGGETRNKKVGCFSMLHFGVGH